VGDIRRIPAAYGVTMEAATYFFLILFLIAAGRFA